nr:hypothetical protein [Tanacetum cinerariifolium]
MASSHHVLKKLMRSLLLTAIPFRQSPSSKLFTATGFPFHTAAETSTSSFRTSKQFLRSIVPYRSQVAVGASPSHFINKKDFHVHISDEDCGKAIEEKKNPKVARALAPFPTIIHNGECLSMLIYMPGMKSNHVNVTVEDNMLLCKGTRPDGKPATHRGVTLLHENLISNNFFLCSGTPEYINQVKVKLSQENEEGS